MYSFLRLYCACLILFFFSCKKKHIRIEPALNSSQIINNDVYFAIENIQFLPGSVPYLFSSNWSFTSELAYLKVEISNKSLQNQEHQLNYTNYLNEILQPNFEDAASTSSFFHGNKADVVFDPPLVYENFWESTLAYNLYLRSHTSTMIAQVSIAKKPEFTAVDQAQTGYELKMQKNTEQGFVLLDYQIQIPLTQISTTDPYQIRSIVMDDTQHFVFLNEEIYIDETGKLIKDGLLFQPKLYGFMFSGLKKIKIRTYLINKNPYIEVSKINRTIAVSDLEIVF